jgi:transcriptional regulator with XRE-family HTH domain
MTCVSPELAHALNALDPAVLGARLRATRLAAGLTQPALAGADASVAYLSRIESGQRRPGPALLETLAERLGVTVDFLVLGEAWEDGRRLELQLDHAELSLVGGDAAQALARVRDVLDDGALRRVPGGTVRARYVEAAALDALGDPAAISAYTRLIDSEPDAKTALKSATARSRIWREQGQLERAISSARSALDSVPPEERGTDEAIRLSLTLAAALFTAGRTEEAADICDTAIAASEELDSPLARASAYWNASVIRTESGDVDEALRLARTAMHLMEGTERIRDIARLRTQLGWTMVRVDPPKLAEAREAATRAAAELDWSAASPADRARNATLEAMITYLEGDLEQAAERTRAVLDTSADLPLIQVIALIVQGRVAWARGEHDEARAAYRRAIAVMTGLGADREAAMYWFDLATLADEAGLPDEARDAYRRAAASAGLSPRLAGLHAPVAVHPEAPE